MTHFAVVSVCHFVVKDSISTSNIHLRSINESKNQESLPEQQHRGYSEAAGRVARPALSHPLLPDQALKHSSGDLIGPEYEQRRGPSE